LTEMPESSITEGGQRGWDLKEKESEISVCRGGPRLRGAVLQSLDNMRPKGMLPQYRNFPMPLSKIKRKAGRSAVRRLRVKVYEKFPGLTRGVVRRAGESNAIFSLLK